MLNNYSNIVHFPAATPNWATISAVLLLKPILTNLDTIYTTYFSPQRLANNSLLTGTCPFLYWLAFSNKN